MTCSLKQWKNGADSWKSTALVVILMGPFTAPKRVSTLYWESFLSFCDLIHVQSVIEPWAIWLTGQQRTERALPTKKRQNHINFARLMPVFLLKNPHFCYRARLKNLVTLPVYLLKSLFTKFTPLKNWPHGSLFHSRPKPAKTLFDQQQMWSSVFFWDKTRVFAGLGARRA